MIDHVHKNQHALLIFFLLGWMMIGCTTIRPAVIEDRPTVDRNIFPNERFDKILPEFVDDRGLVNYSALRDDAGDLEAY